MSNKKVSKEQKDNDPNSGLSINPDWDVITKNDTVIALLKIRTNIENIIIKLDGEALLNYELWKLSQP